MKLYFNSFNNKKFKDSAAVQAVVRKDLEERVVAPVRINISTLPLTNKEDFYPRFNGICIDGLDIEYSSYRGGDQ